MSCKVVCIRHKALSRYIIGHKRCRSCDLFLKWEGSRCPCCGFKLRTTPRNFRLNAKLREQRAIEEAQKSEYYRVIYI
jgi:hypothetical protein